MGKETKEWLLYVAKVIGIVLLMAMLCGCRAVTKVIHDIERIEVRDTLMDTVVQVRLEQETVEKTVCPDDTLRMATKYAEAVCWFDQQNGYINGRLINRQADIPMQVKVRDRVVTKEKRVEVPVEVVRYRTPKWVYELIGLAMLIVGISLWTRKWVK